jgi:predicted Zn-dependent protease
MSELIQEIEEDYPLLIEAGFIAVTQADEDCAKKLFRAAKVLMPESTAWQMGFGYIALNKLEIKEAYRIFHKIVKSEADNYLAQTFLGLSHLLLKKDRAEGEKLIVEAMKKSDDPAVQHLGEVSLKWMEEYQGKDEKTPFFEK